MVVLANALHIQLLATPSIVSPVTPRHEVREHELGGGTADLLASLVIEPVVDTAVDSRHVLFVGNLPEPREVMRYVTLSA